MSVACPKILLVHPNCELYGSDRVMIETVAAIREQWPAADLAIVLPHAGILMDVLRQTEPNVQAQDLWVPRRANWNKTLRRLPRLGLRILAARRIMAAYDLTFINTVTPFDYLIASRLSPSKTIIHVHEILTGHERTMFGMLLAWTKARYVFISQAVRDTYPEIVNRSGCVIWNGVRDFAVTPISAALRPHGNLRIVLVGRFNAWKGQGLLLDAICLLAPAQQNQLEVRLVGSAFAGADHFLTRIRTRIADEALGDRVEICDFDPVPDRHYQWADVVVVPSEKPEPFGLVAIEAMASGRAVIAADHGGLSEIVVDGKTGLRFAPGDSAALARAIASYLSTPTLAERHGQGGRARYQTEFRQQDYRHNIALMIAATLAGD